VAEDLFKARIMALCFTLLIHRPKVALNKRAHRLLPFGELEVTRSVLVEYQLSSGPKIPVKNYTHIHNAYPSQGPVLSTH